MVEPTSPFTLQEAARRLGTAKAISRKDNLSPVDLLAVVMDYEMISSDVMGSGAGCKLWIDDGSLSVRNEQACITFWGVKADQLLQEQKVRVGDLMRFNRFCLKPGRINSEQEAAVHTHEFRRSWEDPEAGPEFYRLGHFDADSGRFIQDNHPTIPSSMLTCATSLERLKTWYQSKKAFDSRGTLSALHCRYLSLSQFQSSRGVVGHLVARVRQIQHPVHDYSFWTGRKRRRGIQLQENQHLLYALLADEKHSITLVDKESRFRSILQQALGKQQQVRLLYVKMQHNYKQVGNDDGVLVPTKDSVVELVSADDEWQTTQSPTQAPIGSATQRSSNYSDDNHSNNAVKLLVSPMTDILVQSSSLMGTNSAHFRALLQDRKICSGYCSACVLIGGKLFVAEGTILKILCGDQDLNEGNWSPLLLDGLLEEQISLEWSISGDRITRVRLPVLP